MAYGNIHQEAEKRPAAGNDVEMAEVIVHPSWKEVLNSEFKKPYFENLKNFVKAEYASGTVYPPGKLIFNALDHTPFDRVKVVILGQDPYHGPGQANGLCFSVNPNTSIPPSLKNIFKEINNDIGVPVPESGDLTRWADQGVLLLNATLTVRAHSPGSHQSKGWEEFTDEVIRQLSEKREGLVFMLWGSYAKKKGSVIDRTKHLVLTAPHPSPLSAHRGFFGCSHFSRTNSYLEKSGKKAINW